MKGENTMSEKRKDSQGRVLKTGESQRKDGKYEFKYVDVNGTVYYICAIFKGIKRKGGQDTESSKRQN